MARPDTWTWSSDACSPTQPRSASPARCQRGRQSPQCPLVLTPQEPHRVTFHLAGCSPSVLGAPAWGAIQSAGRPDRASGPPQSGDRLRATVSSLTHRRPGPTRCARSNRSTSNRPRSLVCINTGRCNSRARSRYWKPKPKPVLTPQPTDSQSVNREQRSRNVPEPVPSPLRDLCWEQNPAFVGLLSLVTGSTLREDIAAARFVRKR